MPSGPRPAKRLLAFAALIVLLLAMGLAACHLGQRKLVYYPGFTRGDAIAADFTLQRPDGAVLRGWADRPDRPRALIYFGGNAETLQAARRQLAASCGGWAAYFVPYRGYGGSDGSPSAAAILPDALALYDEVARSHPGQPVAVIGRSLGSGVAAYVTAHRPVSRLVLVTPFDSLGEVAKHHYPWLPIDLIMRERYDSARWLRGRDLPAVLVIRASEDAVVPAARTDALLRALPASTRVVDVDGDHGSLSQHPAYEAALADFLR